MEYNFNNDELEQFLRDEAEEHTMYPSEHVWDNIRVEVHGETSWHALTFGTLLILLVLTTLTVFNYPPKTIALKTNTLIQKTESVIDNNVAIADKTAVVSLEDQINPESITRRTLETIQQNLLQNDDQLYIERMADVDIVASPLNISPNKTTKEDISPDIAKSTLSTTYPTDNNPKLVTDISDLLDEEAHVATDKSFATSETRKSRLANKLGSPLNSNADADPSADGLLKDFAYQAPEKEKQKTRLEFQVYATPSVSYRKLEDDKTRVYYQSGIQNLNANINNFVRHTPALGFELGAGIAYNITPSFKIKTGLQFNIRQYYIDAYQSYGIATIAIVQNNHLDSVQLFSMFSNSNNNSNLSTKIDNKLYQISIPVGLQWDIINGKKFGLSISGSLQPTYTLNKNVYMISTDYKYYANGAPFFRKLNLNSSAEVNLTYKTGNVKWYIGPQIRYQHYPTYNDVYPIKEYRMDYGLKIGISTPILK
jgi:hypothetical protein